MFTGNEEQTITLAEASAITKNYRDTNPGQVLGGYISRKTLEDILAQSNCVGIRYYYGNNEDGSKELVVVGVLSNEDDIYQGFIGDKSFKSPPYSGVSNPLNT